MEDQTLHDATCKARALPGVIDITLGLLWGSYGMSRMT